jgi:hypothetical protein
LVAAVSALTPRFETQHAPGISISFDHNTLRSRSRPPFPFYLSMRALAAGACELQSSSRILRRARHQHLEPSLHFLPAASPCMAALPRAAHATSQTFSPRFTDQVRYEDEIGRLDAGSCTVLLWSSSCRIVLPSCAPVGLPCAKHRCSAGGRRQLGVRGLWL